MPIIKKYNQYLSESKNLLKVSFDFDSTLQREDIQNLAEFLISKGVDVYITTTRFSDEECMKRFKHIRGIEYCENSNNDLWRVVDKLGIPKSNVNFTNMQDKYHYFENNPDFVWHLDDDDFEVETINEYTDVKSFSVVHNWNDNKDLAIDMLRL